MSAHPWLASSVVFVALAALAPTASALGGATDNSAPCVRCHAAPGSDHVAQWETSIHRRAGVDCLACHPQDDGPNGPSEHGGGLAFGDHHAKAELCGACHSEVLRLFMLSPMWSGAHGDDVPTCTACHSAHGSELLRDDELRQGCARCHSANGPGGHPEVPARASSLLKQLHALGLTRALVREALLSRRAAGADVSEPEARLASAGQIVGDPVLEWHRFDLDNVERATARAIRLLSGIYADLE